MSAPQPKLTAAEARERSLGLSLEALIEMVDAKIELAFANDQTSVTLTDNDIGRGFFIARLCRGDRAHPILMELVEAYQERDYRVIFQPRPRDDGNILGRHPDRICFSW